MLSVTDNSQEARGDAKSVALALPISEINLVRFARNRPGRAAHTTSSVHTLKLMSSFGPKV